MREGARRARGRGTEGAGLFFLMVGVLFFFGQNVSGKNGVRISTYLFLSIARKHLDDLLHATTQSIEEKK